jgi:hypothetical protein
MKTLSEKVLQRRQQRRERRITAALVAIIFVTLLGCTGFISYQSYKRTKAVNAPTWADFTALTPSNKTEGWVITPGEYEDDVPSELTINGERWSLVRVQHFGKPGLPTDLWVTNAMAMTDCAHRTISYIIAADPARLKVNLMHEVFHAGACLHGGATWWNSEDDRTHPGIYHLGEFTATFLHDNPQFAVWEAQ